MSPGIAALEEAVDLGLLEEVAARLELRKPTATRLSCSPVNPVMLVVAKSIEDAEEVGRILRDPTFAEGRYASGEGVTDPVLVVHSSAPDEALAALDAVEEPDSRVHAIVAVGMLKEGWNVKNVYVIVSLRSSVSEILTEQTLGRRLRLPFGAYTGIEILDTLEVVAHERYAELLKRHAAINQAFVDLRTHLEVRRNAQGEDVLVTTTEEVVPPLESTNGGAPLDGAVTVTSLDARAEQAEAEAEAQVELRPRDDLASLCCRGRRRSASLPSSRSRTSRSASTATPSGSSVSGSPSIRPRSCAALGSGRRSSRGRTGSAARSRPLRAWPTASARPVGSRASTAFAASSWTG